MSGNNSTELQQITSEKNLGEEWLNELGFTIVGVQGIDNNKEFWNYIFWLNKVTESLCLPDKRIKEIIRVIYVTNDREIKPNATHPDTEKQNRAKALKEYFHRLFQLLSYIENHSCSYTGEDLRLLVETLQIELAAGADANEINENLLKNNMMSRFLISGEEIADEGMTKVYLGMIILAFIIAGLTLLNVDVGVFASDLYTVCSGSTWNGFDVLGGLGVSAKQMYHGEYAAGSANLIASVTLKACSTAAIIGYHAGTMSMLTISGLLGISFALCMATAFGIETVKAIRCDRRIEDLKKKLNDTKLEPEERKNFERLILLEKAKKADHVRSAFSWACCTVAMTALAVVGCVTAGPWVPFAMSTFGYISALIRDKWVKRVSYVDNIKGAMEGGKDSLFDKLLELSAPNKVVTLGQNPIDLNKPVTISKDSYGFFQKTTSLKEYLSDLLVTDPKRAEKLILALKRNELKRFEANLDTRAIKIGKTNGTKIYEKLTTFNTTSVVATDGIAYT